MFDQQKYYKYTNDIKFEIGFTYCISTIISTILIVIIWQFMESLIITLGIFVLGILFANLYTKGLEIKLQEMYWRLEIYNKIMNRQKKAD